MVCVPASAAVFADVDALGRIAVGSVLARFARKSRQTRTLKLTTQWDEKQINVNIMFLSIVRKRKHKQQLLYYILASISLLLRLYFPPRTISLREYKAMQKKKKAKKERKKREEGKEVHGLLAALRVRRSRYPLICAPMLRAHPRAAASPLLFLYSQHSNTYILPPECCFSRDSLSPSYGIA